MPICAFVTDHTEWPALPYAEWAPTKKTLHMVAQMLGQSRLALLPALREWVHTSLAGVPSSPARNGATATRMKRSLSEKLEQRRSSLIIGGVARATARRTAT